jgi:type IV secretion system protein VirB1
MDLLSLAIICGPWVAPATTLSVIDIESGGHPYAIHDNTANQSYWPANLTLAEQLASVLIRAGHNLDLGLMQINYDAWFKSTRVRLNAAFDPCINVSFGTTILSAAYARESASTLNPDVALKRALSVYNSGDRYRSAAYANRVVDAGHRLLKLKRPTLVREVR